MTPIDRAAQRLAFVRMHLGAQASEPVTASADAGFRSYWRTHTGDGRSREALTVVQPEDGPVAVGMIFLQ